MPRRKAGTLLPLETEILGAALTLQRSEQSTFHGFGLARAMREQRGSRALTGHGTLYKALGRLEELGLLTSRWEEPEAAEGRPRRRLYELTAEGARAARQGEDKLGAFDARLENRCQVSDHGVAGDLVAHRRVGDSGRRPSPPGVAAWPALLPHRRARSGAHEAPLASRGGA